MNGGPKQIMVAIDLDELSIAALRKAAFYARAFESHLDVVHIYASSAPMPPIPLPGTNALHDEATRALRDETTSKVGRMLEPEPLTDIDHQVHVLHHASPGDALCQLAAERSVELLVVGSHHRTGLGRVLLGSVAERIVRSAPCDVLVVRAKASGTG